MVVGVAVWELMLPGCASLVTRRVPVENGLVRLSLRQYPELTEPRGSLRLMPDGWEDPVYLLALDGGGFAAVSSICTHRACTVDLGGPGLACPCHGSEYDREGKVVKGPASRALTRYAIRVSGDELVIEVGAAP